MPKSDEENLRAFLRKSYPTASDATIDQYVEEFKAVAHLIVRMARENTEEQGPSS